MRREHQQVHHQQVHQQFHNTKFIYLLNITHRSILISFIVYNTGTYVNSFPKGNDPCIHSIWSEIDRIEILIQNMHHFLHNISILADLTLNSMRTFITPAQKFQRMTEQRAAERDRNERDFRASQGVRFTVFRARGLLRPDLFMNIWPVFFFFSFYHPHQRISNASLQSAMYSMIRTNKNGSGGLCILGLAMQSENRI